MGLRTDPLRGLADRQKPLSVQQLRTCVGDSYGRQSSSHNAARGYAFINFMAGLCFKIVFILPLLTGTLCVAVMNETTDIFSIFNNGIVCVILTRYIPEPQ